MESDSFLGNIRNEISTIYTMVFVIIGIQIGIIFMIMMTIFMTWTSKNLLIKNINEIESDKESLQFH